MDKSIELNQKCKFYIIYFHKHHEEHYKLSPVDVNQMTVQQDSVPMMPNVHVIQRNCIICLKEIFKHNVTS